VSLDLPSRVCDVRPLWPLLLERVKQFVFRRITRPSTGMCLRGRAIISVGRQITGTGEPDITHLVDQIVELGCNEFLIDIGANIGLMACHNGPKFGHVHMYEPNPICVEVLRANCMVMLNSTPHHIHAFALSEADGSETLRIPKHYWVGAFVHRDNAYSYDLLSRKDRFHALSDANYLLVNIPSRNAAGELTRVFGDLLTQGLRLGAVKIDVAGDEEQVFSHILDACRKPWSHLCSSNPGVRTPASRRLHAAPRGPSRSTSTRAPRVS
jgi:FkbM family methyltransferase